MNDRFGPLFALSNMEIRIGLFVLMNPGSRSGRSTTLATRLLLAARRADMSLLVRTTHYTYCPYKGDCTYYSIAIGGAKSEYAVWAYEEPYDAVANIKEYLAFYPTRVDAIEVVY